MRHTPPRAAAAAIEFVLAIALVTVLAMVTDAAEAAPYPMEAGRAETFENLATPSPRPS